MSTEIYASTGRTATPVAEQFGKASSVAAIFVIDVTAKTATPSVVFTVEGFDSVSGKWYALLASAAITGTGTTVLRIGPGETPVDNLIASGRIPSTLRVRAVHGDSDSITYTVSVQFFER